MADATQDKGSAPGGVTARPDEGDRYDPLRAALRTARDAFDPNRALLERRAPTAPLVWYIEDTPDMALPRSGPDRGVRTRSADTEAPLRDFDTAAGIV